MFLNCSTGFKRHTAHHQELKHCNCGLWFYIRLWLPAAFDLLMMSGVSLETCWAIKKHWNSIFYYTVASCWLFLYDFHLNFRTRLHCLYLTKHKCKSVVVVVVVVMVVVVVVVTVIVNRITLWSKGSHFLNKCWMCTVKILLRYGLP
jgi:hypothetical protein